MAFPPFALSLMKLEMIHLQREWTLPIGCPLPVTCCIAIFVYFDPDIPGPSGSLSVGDFPQVNAHGAFNKDRSG